MLTEKQANYIKYLLGRKGYHSEDYGWLNRYSKREAGKLIDKLLKDEWRQWAVEFIMSLPPPTEKRKRQAFLPLPEPEPMPLDDAAVPDERREFKRWGREVYQKGELTFTQLGELYDSRFGSPFST